MGPRSPSHSPFILNQVHRMQRQRGPKIGSASPVPSLTPFSTCDHFLVPLLGQTVPPSQAMESKTSFLPSRAATFPPPPPPPPPPPGMRSSSNDDPSIARITTVTDHEIINSCHFHRRHGPIEPAGAHGGRTVACSC